MSTSISFVVKVRETTVTFAELHEKLVTVEAQQKKEKKVATHVPTSAFVEAKPRNFARSQQ